MGATMTAPTNGKVAAPAKQWSIRDYLLSPGFNKQISELLPSHIKPERMIRVAIAAMTKTPALADCDQQTFFRCMLDLSQIGLEPDGRHAHLIPIKNTKRGVLECNLWIDYKGLVQLAYRAGVKSIHAEIVCTGDLFVYNRGDVEQHVPWFLRMDAAKPAEPGDMIAVYCRIILPGDAVKSEVMSTGEVDAIRARSKAKDSGPWVTDYFEMAKKTVLKRASKWIPLSAEFRDALDRDFDTLPPLQSVPTLPPVSSLTQLTERLTKDRNAVVLESDHQPTDPPPDETMGESVDPDELAVLDRIGELSRKLGMSDLQAETERAAYFKTRGIKDATVSALRAYADSLEGRMEQE